MEYKNKFQERLLTTLSARKMKQIELAEKSGLSRSRISQYCSGYRVPKQDKVYLLAKVLNVSPSWLWGISEIMDVAPTQTKSRIVEKIDALNEEELQKVEQMLNVMFPNK